MRYVHPRKKYQKNINTLFPMNAFRRTAIHHFLDSVFIGTIGIMYFAYTIRSHFKYLGQRIHTKFASCTFLFIDIHSLWHRILQLSVNYVLQFILENSHGFLSFQQQEPAKFALLPHQQELSIPRAQPLLLPRSVCRAEHSVLSPHSRW